MKLKILTIFLVLIQAIDLDATPTSLFWTNCTTSVLPTGMGHLDFDNFADVFSPHHRNAFFDPDLGFLLGVFTWKNFSAEVGIDYLAGANNPIYFNGKIGIQENKLTLRAPSFSLGVFNIGTHNHGSNKTNQNIVDVVFGKSLPGDIGGAFYAGGFSGSKAIGKNRQGFWVGFSRAFAPTKDKEGKEFNKWTFSADYASGKNEIGGGGFAFTYNFTPEIVLQAGPVWFNSIQINGHWKLSVQIGFDFPVFRTK